MSLVESRDMSPAAVRHRLMNPQNPVRDLGIDLKRKVIPISNFETSQEGASLDVFGPLLPSVDDLAFGPIVHPLVVIRTYRIEDIQRVVAAKYNVSRLDLISARRHENIIMPRHIAMFLARTLTARSLPEIGRRFGGRDHTTALHAVRKIETLRCTDQILNSQILELIEAITSD